MFPYGKNKPKSEQEPIGPAPLLNLGLQPAESAASPEKTPAEKDEAQTPAHLRRRQFNLPPALLTLAALLLLAIVVPSVHAIQVQRFADQFLERAATHETAEDWKQAADYLSRYIGLRPDDVDARQRLGEALAAYAKTPRQWLRVFLAYEDVLRRDPTRHELRRRQAELALRLGRFSDAQTHLEHLLSESPEDGELDFLLAMALEAQDDFEAAADRYRRALAHGYDQPRIYGRLAGLLRRAFQRHAEADDIIAQMVANHADKAESYLIRAIDRLESGDWQAALEDAREAEKRDPLNADAVLLAGRLELVRVGDGSEVDHRARRDRLEAASREHPDDWRLHEMLARWVFATEGASAAIDVLQQAVQRFPDLPHLRWMLADIAINEGRTALVEEQLEWFKQHKRGPAYGDYIEGRRLVQEGRLVEAVQLLRKVHLGSAGEPALARLAGLALADCYGRMGNPGAQLDVCRSLLDQDPLVVEARLMAANALMHLGRRADALAMTARIAPTSPQAALQTARRMLSRLALQLPSQRDWKPFDEAIKAAEARSADAAEVGLLQVEALLLKDQRDEATALLGRLREDFPQHVGVRLAQARLKMIDRQIDEARAILDQTQADCGDSVDLRLAKARLLAQQAKSLDELADGLRRLRDPREHFSREQQIGLLEGLAAWHRLAGDVVGALELWKELAQTYPEYLPAQVRWYALAIQLGRQDEAATAYRNLERIDGANGPHVLVARALRQLVVLPDGVTRPTREQLVSARDLLAEAARLQSTSSWIPAILARVEEQLGNKERALEQYRRAIELGSREPAVIDRLVRLLLEQERYDDVDRLIAELEPNVPAVTWQQLRRFAAATALARGDIRRAQLAARESVPETSQRVEDHLWLGNLLLTLGDREGAEAALRRAKELGNDRADVWLALIRFLAVTDRAEEAAQAFDEARQHVPESAHFPFIPLAQEALGRTEEAARAFDKAVSDSPRDVRVIKEAASFFGRHGAFAKARKLLQTLLGDDVAITDEDRMWARRTLAALLANGDYQSYLKAISLIDENLREQPESAVDRVAKARLLAARGDASDQHEAIRTLESLDRETPLRRDDRLFLAGLCDAVGEPVRAQKHWDRLLRDESDDAVVLSAYIRRSIRRDDFGEAERWLDVLRRRQPRSALVATLASALALKREDATAALDEVHEFLGDPETADLQKRVAPAASMLASLFAEARFKNLPEAERLGHEADALLSRLGEDKPTVIQVRARVATDLGRLEEAFQLLDRAVEKKVVKPLDAALFGIALLRRAQGDDSFVDTIRRWIAQGAEEKANAIQAAMVRAELFDFLGRYDDAIAVYQNLLKQNPEHPIALNNLAWFVAVRKGQAVQGMQYIDRALAEMGPHPELLDTRGSIRLAAGEVDAAVADFREAMRRADIPRIRFHLAQGSLAAGDIRAARFHFRKALESGLSPDSIHPLEREAFEKLSRLVEAE